MEKNEEIEKLSRLIDDAMNVSRIVNNVMNESDLFNQTLIEVADRLIDLIICSKVGGYTVKSLSDKAYGIFKFIEEKYNELSYCDVGDYFHNMLSKLQQDKHEAHMEKIKEYQKKK